MPQVFKNANRDTNVRYILFLRCLVNEFFSLSIPIIAYNSIPSDRGTSTSANLYSVYPMEGGAPAITTGYLHTRRTSYPASIFRKWSLTSKRDNTCSILCKWDVF